MTSKTDRAYILDRLRANRLLAERSTQSSVRDMHRQYVRFYQSLLRNQV